ncbi:MAG: glucosaminidase domain-containing protein [Alphaproteobacteria bacterium]|nr:glucosaminidase domain-containing protein [Alphaproteobacteria bacterium]
MDRLKNYQLAAAGFAAVIAIIVYGAVTAFSTDLYKVIEKKPADHSIVVSNTQQLPISNIVLIEEEKIPIRLVNTVDELRGRFSAASFELWAVRNGKQSVPRLFADTLPGDLEVLSEVTELKQTFFRTLLPLILKANEEILADRSKLELLKSTIEARQEINELEKQWLYNLSKIYNVTSGNITELLNRVDAISPALALAQSAQESGWGRSRFALKGNALFGQRTWDEGFGMVPKRRSGKYEVKSFPSLIDSVRSYARNLNIHPAYRDFRLLRAEMRAKNILLNPYDLVGTLEAYSERRDVYVKTIRKILRTDRLEELEATKLESRSVRVKGRHSSPS